MKNEPKKLEEKELTVVEPTDLQKPENDTRFAHEAAKLLVDIIEKNRWSISLGGKSKHIMYEGWVTAGKYYGYMVKTFDAKPVEIGGITGFVAKAEVINEKTGIIVGGAEAYCMKDEFNWKAKPMFQLASMAQTRAGSKALRQLLSFVVALAGYSATPAEEMDNIQNTPKSNQIPAIKVPEVELITPELKSEILDLLFQKGKSRMELDAMLFDWGGRLLEKLTKNEAYAVIKKIKEQPKVEVKPEVDLDQVEEKLGKIYPETKRDFKFSTK